MNWKPHFLNQETSYSDARGQFIGRPQTFVELQLCINSNFPSVKMQFET